MSNWGSQISVQQEAGQEGSGRLSDRWNISGSVQMEWETLRKYDKGTAHFSADIICC